MRSVAGSLSASQYPTRQRGGWPSIASRVTILIRAPTPENPERWDCDCGGLWRILTLEQVRQKFAHSKHGLRGGRAGSSASGEAGARPAHSRSVSPAPAPAHRRSVCSWAPTRQGQR